MKRKEFIFTLASGTAAVMLEPVNIILAGKKSILVFCMGSGIPSAAYKLCRERGIDCCHLHLNQKGITLKNGVKHIILGNPVKKYDIASEKHGIFIISQEVEEKAVLENRIRIIEMLNKGYSHLIILANLGIGGESPLAAPPLIAGIATGLNIRVYPIINTGLDLFYERDFDFDNDFISRFKGNADELFILDRNFIERKIGKGRLGTMMLDEAFEKTDEIMVEIFGALVERINK